ncbi:unnamed protein product, partial [Prorocentrum cordatum]
LGPPPLGRTPPPESRKEPRPNRHPLPRNSSPTHTCCAPSAPDLYDAKCATCNSCNHPTARRWDATARQSRSQNYKRLWGRRGPLVRSACTSGGQEERERSGGCGGDGSGGGGGGGDGCGGDGGGGGSLQSPSAPEGAEVLLAHVRGRPRGHQAGARSLPVEAARGVQL